MTLDLCLAAVVLVFGLFGLASGLLKQLSQWIGLVLGAAASWPLAGLLAPALAARLGLPPAGVKVGLCVPVFLLLFLAGSLLCHAVLKRAAGDSVGAFRNRFWGFMLGAGKAAAAVFLALSVAAFYERPLLRALGRKQAPAQDSAAARFVRAHRLFGESRELPSLAQVEKLLAAARRSGDAQGQELQAELRRLLDDPGFDPGVKNDKLGQALRSGDLSSLKDDPRFAALLKHPALAGVLTKPEGGPQPAP